MIVYKDLLTGDELLSDSFPYREIENGMLWEVDGKCVDQGAIDVDIGANSSARWHESKLFALVAPQSLPPGDSPVPVLWLDSGAATHVVGDYKILTNIRDPPSKMVVTVADGYQHLVTKVGVIQAPNINISDVYLAPGLETNLISVRQLAKSEIVTTFYKNYAELWLHGERIGGAIVDDDVSLYRLYFFKPKA